MLPATVNPGASYVIVVEAAPAMHSCSITMGATGIAPTEGMIVFDVACKGPDTNIAVSAPGTWIFDPTLDIQPVLEASVLLQDLTVTVNSAGGQLTSARIAGVPVALGKPSSPLVLAMGMNSIDVDVVAQAGLTMTFKILIDRGGLPIQQSAYVKASNAGRGDAFGQSIAISGDTLVVGAPKESSNATNVNGNQLDDSAPNAGAAYVFHRTPNGWMQEAYLKASNTQANSSFGWSVAIDGDTIAVGAIDVANGAGAVYVFQRVQTSWMQQAIISASNAEAGDTLGWTVALSGDTLAVSAVNESSRATGGKW